MAIDNLTHFTSFTHLSSMVEKRDTIGKFLRSFTIIENYDSLLEEAKYDYKSVSVFKDEDLKLDEDELEKVRQDGMFKFLDKEDEKQPEDPEDDQEDSKEDIKQLNKDTTKNLNDLVIKRMESLMNKATTRKPLSGEKYEELVKDIREGKFKICIPAVTLVFKYLVKMFKVIQATMKEAINDKNKAAFKKFMIYASKFSLISEVLFSAFNANENDILYKSLSSPDWDEFFKVYDFYEPEDLEKFSKQYTTLCEFLGKCLDSEPAFKPVASFSQSSFGQCVHQQRQHRRRADPAVLRTSPIRSVLPDFQEEAAGAVQPVHEQPGHRLVPEGVQHPRDRVHSEVNRGHVAEHQDAPGGLPPHDRRRAHSW